jgi:hypothetical protein
VLSSQKPRVHGHAVGPWTELVARTLWTTTRESGKEAATPLTGDRRTAGRAGEHARPCCYSAEAAQGVQVLRSCMRAHYCASCGRERTKEAFDKGRVVAQKPESLARRSTAQKKHAGANRAWKPSTEFAWITREVYTSEILPRLGAVKISTLQSALGVSEPYAGFIRSGSCIPHQRHWQTLSQLVGVGSRYANV